MSSNFQRNFGVISNENLINRLPVSEGFFSGKFSCETMPSSLFSYFCDSMNNIEIAGRSFSADSVRDPSTY